MFDYDDLEVKFEERDTKAKATASAAEPKSSGYVATPSPAPPIGARKIRVLALHGGGSNTNIMQYQVMPLRRILGDQAEWDFLNGGRDWKFNDGHGVPDIMKALAAGMPFFGWYGVENDDKTTRTYEEKLFDPSVTFTYKEVDLGVERVLQRIKEHGPVDVILGFSQGCIVSHLIAGLLRERGQEIPWRLSVLFNGMRVRDRRYEKLFETPLDLPCVMVFGKQDEFYHYGKASQSVLYKDPIVLEHDEGHKFPSAAPKAKEIYDEVVRQIYWRCGLPDPRNKI